MTAMAASRCLDPNVDHRQIEAQQHRRYFGRDEHAAEEDARMIEPTVVPSIQPFATTSCCGSNSSVRIPYFAGEYAAAPNPRSRRRATGAQ
jgi:hypothetical protein